MSNSGDDLRVTLAEPNRHHLLRKTAVEWPDATPDIHVQAQCMTFPT